VQVEDCVAAYIYLVDQLNYSPDNIVIGGDSAGGGLSALVIIALRDQPRFSRYKLPAGVFFVSPYTDLSFNYPSIDSNKETDRWVRKAWLEGMANTVITSANSLGSPLTTTDPPVSPYYADLHNLVPMLMIVTDQEIMRDDGVRFHQKAISEGNPSQLEVLAGFHAMHLFADHLPEGQDVIERIASFVNTHVLS